MAGQDIQSSGVAQSEATSVASAPSRPAEGRFEEFSRVASDLSMTLNRTIILVGIIVIGAIALIYWGAYTEHYFIMAGAMGVFALAMPVWVVANAYVAWAVIRGSVKWWAANRWKHSRQEVHM